MPVHGPSCAVTIPSEHFWAYWIPITALEFVLFSLAVFKAVEIARKELGTPRILEVLLRDSVMYFGGILAIIIANLVLYRLAKVCRIIFPLNYR